MMRRSLVAGSLLSSHLAAHSRAGLAQPLCVKATLTRTVQPGPPGTPVAVALGSSMTHPAVSRSKRMCS